MITQTKNIIKSKLYKLVKTDIRQLPITQHKFIEDNTNGNDIIYVVKKKVNSGIWNTELIYSRKRFSNIFTIMVNGGKLESDKDFENRVITEFNKQFL